MKPKGSAASKLLFIALLAGSLLQLHDVDGHGNNGTRLAIAHGNNATRLTVAHGNNGTRPTIAHGRSKRRAPQPQQGFFFPIAMYTVRHHRPASERGRNVRPETWEYRGQYFYGYKPKANSGRRQAARLLAAGLPLLLAPLLSIIFSFPVLVPLAQTTSTVSPIGNGVSGASGGLSGHYGGGLGGHYGGSTWMGRRKRRRRRSERRSQQRDKWNRMKELEVVANYLRQVDYDERQQSRVMVNYLQCNGLLSTDDHCLERLSCEFADPANLDAPELERTVTSILLGHMLNNEYIPRPFKKRLKSAAVFGKNNSGKCSKYFCHHVDDNWDYASVYPQDMPTNSPSPNQVPIRTKIPPPRLS